MTKETASKRHHLVELVWLIIQAALIALVIRTFLFQPFNIPSGSMKATLLVGDYLFVSKFSYGYSRYSLPFYNPSQLQGRIFDSQPERGDVVVFRLPSDDSTDYIKRVIGLPGDKIKVTNGHLHINGEPVQRIQLEDYIGEEPCPRMNRVKRWRETLSNGVTYETLDCYERSTYDNTDEYVVPANHYFMMGDNRDNSTDSRVSQDQYGVGFVPYDNLVGKAQIIFFSIYEGERALEIWRWPVSVRWARLFSLVR